jgi:hypothetical protein
MVVGEYKRSLELYQATLSSLYEFFMYKHGSIGGCQITKATSFVSRDQGSATHGALTTDVFSCSRCCGDYRPSLAWSIFGKFRRMFLISINFNDYRWTTLDQQERCLAASCDFQHTSRYRSISWSCFHDYVQWRGPWRESGLGRRRLTCEPCRSITGDYGRKES